MADPTDASRTQAPLPARRPGRVGSGAGTPERAPPRGALGSAIVGRERILVRLDELVAPAAAGATLQLVGEAGLGKTRLARAAAERAGAHRRLVLEGRARATDTVLPLGIFQDALRADLRARPDAPRPADPLEVAFPAQLLPELGGGGGAGVDRAALFESASRYVRALARPSGLLLVLEDLHWADPSSLALAGYVAQTTRAEPVALLLTYRPDEAAADSPLGELRNQLARERLGDEVLLDPLDGEGVEALLEHLLGTAPDRGLNALIARLSGGNPFLVEELVREAVEAGRLDPASGSLRGEGGLGLPRTAQELLLARARRLDPSDQELLRWAAVIGERLDPRLLAGAAGLGEEEALAALGRLHAAGLVVDDEADASGVGVRFRHALTREAVLGQLLRAERRHRHARVLEAAEALYADAPQAPLEQLAEHALAAGDRARGFRYSLQAAHRSRELAGYAEAEAHFARALSLWDPDEGEDARAALLLDYGLLVARLRRDPRGVDYLGRAREAYLALGERGRAALALAAATEARIQNGERERVLEDLETARAELRHDDPPELQLQVLPPLASSLLRAGELRGAAAAAEQGLAYATLRSQPAERLAEIQLLTVLGAARWLAGEAAAGRETLRRGYELARHERDEVGAARACFWLACAHLSGSAGEAARWAEEGLALGSGRELHLTACWCLSVRALIHLRAGEWEATARLLTASDRALAEVGPDPVVRLGLDWIRGESALARCALEEALATLDTATGEADALGDLEAVSRARLGLARARLAAGDAAGARAALEPAIARWERAPGGALPTPPSLLVCAVETALGNGDAKEAARRAGELAARVGGPRAGYAQGLAAAAAGHRPVPGALGAAAGEMEASGWRWEAARMRIVGAEALAGLEGAREEALALASAAFTQLRALGSEGWCRRVEGLLRRLGQRAPTRGAGPGREGLTAREIEVLQLVAEGFSNRRIAERLVISEATATRHVANIFGKLGVHTRAEAARIAAERGLAAVRPQA
jgi:DNA-binding CsgD family transcriptional regulator